MNKNLYIKTTKKISGGIEHEENVQGCEVSLINGGNYGKSIATLHFIDIDSMYALNFNNKEVNIKEIYIELDRKCIKDLKDKLDFVLSVI